MAASIIICGTVGGEEGEAVGEAVVGGKVGVPGVTVGDSVGRGVGAGVVGDVVGWKTKYFEKEREEPCTCILVFFEFSGRKEAKRDTDTCTY